MMALRRVIAAAALALLPALAVAQAGPGDLAIVAHPGVPTDGVTLPELRQLFKAERQY